MGWVAAKSGWKSQLFFVRVWLAVTLLLVVSTQTIAAPEAFGDDPSTVVNSASDFPLEGTAPEDAPSASALYAGQFWTVNEARAEQVEGLLVRPKVEVDVTVTNTLTATDVRVPDSTVSLVSNSGDMGGEARFVDAGARLTIAPGESVDVTIIFEVAFTQAPSLDDLSLEIGEPNRIPAVIALAGTDSPDDYPIFAAIDSTPVSLTDPDAATRQIVVTASGATFDVNAGSYRAAVGEQLALIKIEVQRTVADPDAGFLENDFWSLETDDGSFDAVFVAQADDLTATNTDELTLLFAFPEGSQGFSLTAGASSTNGASIAVVLPN